MTFQAGGLPTALSNTEQYVFTGNSFAQGVDWRGWKKPSSRGMAHILLIGAGAGGGTGRINGAGLSAGGSGGGSGGQIMLLMPLIALPEVIFLSLAMGRSSNDADGVNTSYIAIEPSSSRAQSTIAYANGGGMGGNASSNASVFGGGGGAISTLTSMILGTPYVISRLAGQSGADSGGGNAAGVSITLPTTGLLVAGGAGGAGLANAAGNNGFNGGTITVPASPSPYPAVVQSLGSTSATVPPVQGANGFEASPVGLVFYPGAGGGSTHSSATGAGLVQAGGGSGGYGCGGGGGGGALTGSTAAVGSRGGDAICIITCW